MSYLAQIRAALQCKYALAHVLVALCSRPRRQHFSRAKRALSLSASAYRCMTIIPSYLPSISSISILLWFVRE